MSLVARAWRLLIITFGGFGERQRSDITGSREGKGHGGPGFQEFTSRANESALIVKKVRRPENWQFSQRISSADARSRGDSVSVSKCHAFVAQAPSQAVRNRTTSPGGCNHRSATVGMNFGRTRTHNPRCLRAWNASSSLFSSPRNATGTSAPTSCRSCCTASHLSHERRRNSIPPSNSRAG